MGKKRHIYEFAYMFNFLKILGYIPVDNENHYNIALEEYTITELGKNGSKELILVICDTEIHDYVAFMQKYDCRIK